ncbi:MAG: hypothetical protein WAU82_06170 [Candidatus Binatus sp.]|uniref:hypothetical protein n=1 Tax=Candidatus Binatus sp. TaxID=2811406 RepID=UPI003BAEDB0D
MLYFLWILFDAALALRMATMTSPPSLVEIALWALGGLVIAVIAWIADHRSTKALNMTIADLNEKLLVGQTQLSTKADMLALLGGETFRTLQANTQTTGGPASAVIDAANKKIEALQVQIGKLDQQAPRRISADQRQKFRDSLDGKTPVIWETYCVSTDSEADSYAKQLTRMFREAGMSAGYSVSTDNFDSPALDQFGLTIHHKGGEFPDDARALAWAFDQAGIRYGLTSERVVPHADPRYLGLRIGRKPE